MKISATTMNYTCVTTTVTLKNNDIRSEETYKNKKEYKSAFLANSFLQRLQVHHIHHLNFLITN